MPDPTPLRIPLTETSGNPVLKVEPQQATDKAIHLIITRNSVLNAQNADLRLATTPTPEVQKTAARLVEFQKQLKQAGGDLAVAEFYREPYNITWLEQIMDIDAKKVALALTTRVRVQQIMQEHGIDPQYGPALSLGAFVAIDKLQELNLDYAATRTAIEQLNKSIKSQPLPGEQSVRRHLVEYLESLPKGSGSPIGRQRNELLTDMITRDIAKRLIQHSRHATILKQSQGIEVEVLQRLEYTPAEGRTTKRLQLQMERAERYGIDKTWLPRGIRADQHRRTDWHLTNMLGIPEDIAEKKYEWFEMSTNPTDASSAQATILHELKLGGFITEDILSETWEKYSMHAATTFPDTVWNDSNTQPKDQYVFYARGLAGAFASTQRGVYGGYVFDDVAGSGGREIADKTLETGKFKAVAGHPELTKAGKRLVEMRVLDLTETGQNAIELHKPYFDFAFRCYWEISQNVPLQNLAEYRAANVWAAFMEELETIYKKYDIPLNPNSNEWRAVGWKKAENPQVQKDLASLFRNHSRTLRAIVDHELTRPEAIPSHVDRPIELTGLKVIGVGEFKETALHDPQLAMSGAEASQYGLADGQMVFMRFGEIKRPVFVHVDGSQPEQSYRMNTDLQRLLHLPDKLATEFRFNALERELNCGPLLGIPVVVEDETLAMPFGEQTEYHRSVIMAARLKGITAYSFDISPNADNFDPYGKTITGITLSADGTKWIRATLPYPDVIFSRNFGERSRIKVLEIAHIPHINNDEFVDFIADKLRLPEAICANPKLKEYVPETVQYDGVAGLKDMLSRHETVYLKPKWGMRSEGVVRFDRLPDGRIRYKHTIQGTDPTDTSYSWPEKGEPGYEGYVVKSIEDALQATESFRKQFIYESYIVQQGIGGIESYEGGRPFELRFLFQRNANGEPEIMGWDQGQKTYWMPVIRRLFGAQNADIVATNGVNLAKALSLQIQQQFGSNFGQYSIQVAIDNHGKTWLLEANPKPGVTNQFHYLHLDNVTDLSSDHIADLTKSMAGFAKEPSVPQVVDRVTLKDGSQATIAEETNPYIIFEFAQRALGAKILRSETSVYNLKTIRRIQENIANRTRYLLLRNQEGEIIGCTSIIRPKSQYMIELDDPAHPTAATRKRWEIGGVLTTPGARGKGVAQQLFDTSVAEIQKAPREYDSVNKKYVDEILVNVTGTRDPNQLGVTRPDSAGIERIVRGYRGNRRIGAVPGSYGPIYVFPISTALG